MRRAQSGDADNLNMKKVVQDAPSASLPSQPRMSMSPAGTISATVAGQLRPTPDLGAFPIPKL